MPMVVGSAKRLIFAVDSRLPGIRMEDVLHLQTVISNSSQIPSLPKATNDYGHKVKGEQTTVPFVVEVSSSFLFVSETTLIDILLRSTVTNLSLTTSLSNVLMGLSPRLESPTTLRTILLIPTE